MSSQSHQFLDITPPPPQHTHNPQHCWNIVIYGTLSQISSNDTDDGLKIPKTGFQAVTLGNIGMAFISRIKHYENMLKLKHVKVENLIRKILIFLIFFVQKIDCGYKLQPPHRGSSDEYLQSMFWTKNKNQRTNGPVNAHLRSASYTNKHI